VPTVPQSSGGPRVLVRTDSVVASTGAGEVVTFDRAGRLYSVFADGAFYRRGVDGRVVEKATVGGRIGRRRLDPVPARAIVRRALAVARGVPGMETHPPLEDLDGDAARFRAVYAGPIPILPPDLYRALVLQATVGCAYNACLFCRFYADRPFRVREVAEFRAHRDAVARSFGAGLSMRRGLFLGDADALVAPTDRLLAFAEAARALPPAAQGIYCFGALFGEPGRGPSEWEALREAGLRRVYLGVETGNDELRGRLGKPGTARAAIDGIVALKGAGIAVGVILLVGAGGDAYAARHVADSVALVRAARLDADDFVYLSPLVDPKGRISAAARAEQSDLLREGIGEGPRVAVYDIRAFVY